MSNTLLDQKVQKIVDRLSDFAQQVSSVSTTHERERFFALMSELDCYIASITDENVFNAFYHSKHFRYFAELFSSYYQYYLRAIEALESSFVQRSIFSDTSSSVSDKLSSEYMKDQFQIKTNDLGFIDFSQVKKIVMVGSGPFPETILFMAENFDIPEIIGIDINEEAVFLAGELVHYLGVSNVQIKYKNGLDFDYSDVDAVYIAEFVSPKNKILDRIAETAPNHVQIIVKAPELMGKIFYENILEDNLHNLLKIEKQKVFRSKFCMNRILKIGKYPDL